ncbi:MAG: hypothetical protein Q8Q95_04165 [bacterium]|nr:hypothetical protein [bacterium]
MKAHAQLIALVLIGLLAVVANIRVPDDFSADVQWLTNEVVAQGDSIQTLAAKQDSSAVAMVLADSVLRAEMYGRTKVLADSAIALRASLTKLQKSANRVKKLEGQAKESLDISKLTQEELELLKRTFGDHVALRAKDAHGDKRIAKASFFGQQTSSADPASSWGSARKGKNF